MRSYSAHASANVASLTIFGSIQRVNSLSVYDKAVFGDQGELKLDFIGRSNIWVDNDYSDGVVQLVRFLILESLRKTYPGQLDIAVFDSKLSGIFAPFSSLSAGDGRLKMLSSESVLQEHLEHMRQHVQSVQNKIKGECGSLIDFREMRGKRDGTFNLVVLSVDAFTLDKETRAALSLLMDVGPAAGISFLIVSTTTDAPVGMTSRCSVVTVESGKVHQHSQAAEFHLYSAKEIAAFCTQLELEDSQVGSGSVDDEVVDFAEIHQGINPWSANSTDGLTFLVGQLGQETFNITLGDRKNQRHNMLITGAVGQGKSNLISVIIHSLCLRYSPKELNLYLLDYKEGVTLQPFANIGRDEYLPHAKALGLECDEGFGLAVLEHLFGEYRRRLRLFKQANVRDLAEYRRKLPTAELPRIVTIIDEFQLMFGNDDSQARRIAELLEKSVRLFRAAGIHFILASQSLGGNFALLGKSDVIFSQIPIRIAYKNSVSESLLTLGQDNREASYLKSREAIVNVDYGEISQNRMPTIAFADEAVLQPLRFKWWTDAKLWTVPPRIYDGESLPTPASASTEIVALAKSTPSFVPLGLSSSLESSLVAVGLEDDNGKNIAFFGNSPNMEQHQVIGMIQAIALAVAQQEPQPKLVFANFLDQSQFLSKLIRDLVDILRHDGADVLEIEPGSFSEFINESTSSLDACGRQTYLFGIDLDRWNFNPDCEEFIDIPPLKKLSSLGPSHGFHLIGWWSKALYFSKQVARSESEATKFFNTRVFLRVSTNTVRELGSPKVLNWTPQESKVLLIDETQFEAPTEFTPFVPLISEQLAQFSSELNRRK